MGAFVWRSNAVRHAYATMLSYAGYRLGKSVQKEVYNNVEL